eukprot:3093289-Pleurochrysis_carterae.AAC.1
MHDFDEGDDASRRKRKDGTVGETRAPGYFHRLPQVEQRGAVQVAMKMRAHTREEARRDLAEQQRCFAHKREQASQKPGYA